MLLLPRQGLKKDLKLEALAIEKDANLLGEGIMYANSSKSSKDILGFNLKVEKVPT